MMVAKKGYKGIYLSQVRGLLWGLLSEKKNFQTKSCGPRPFDVFDSGG